MVTILKWVIISLLGALTVLHASITASLFWHMYRYDVPGAWIPEKGLFFQYLIALASILGLSTLLRYANPIERKACIVVLTVVSISFSLFLFLHLTDRLTAK